MKVLHCFLFFFFSHLGCCSTWASDPLRDESAKNEPQWVQKWREQWLMFSEFLKGLGSPSPCRTDGCLKVLLCYGSLEVRIRGSRCSQMFPDVPRAQTACLLQRGRPPWSFFPCQHWRKRWFWSLLCGCCLNRRHGNTLTSHSDHILYSDFAVLSQIKKTCIGF